MFTAQLAKKIWTGDCVRAPKKEGETATATPDNSGERLVSGRGRNNTVCRKLVKRSKRVGNLLKPGSLSLILAFLTENCKKASTGGGSSGHQITR